MSRRRWRGGVPVALLASFGAGALIDGWFRTHGPPKPAQPPGPSADTLHRPRRRAVSGAGRPRRAATPSGSRHRPAAGRHDRRHVRVAGLRMPIDGEAIEALKGGFAERRDGDRPHEAVDMLAPRNTPVHAVENGTIAKLFISKAGGITIYQFDPTGRLCYYYAHLERYADGLKDGQAVSQGDVIGYVGTSGNAPANTPHLHFAVFELNADKRWWQGKAVDPYEVFKNRS